MRVALLTREYPPDVYGGAGVHVEYLARELGRLVEVSVDCEGGARAAVAPVATVRAHRPWGALDGANDALRTMSTDLAMAAAVTTSAAAPDLVHSHT
nr:glycosyltransferase [Micromonospora sp. DSM 115978]